MGVDRVPRLSWGSADPVVANPDVARHCDTRIACGHFRMTSELYDELRGRQARAVESLIGAGRDRTYTEAAEAAGMLLGTLYTHLRRVRCNHPKMYAAIRKVRKAQVAIRHRNAVANARAHTRAYFRRIRRSQLYLLTGYW